MGSLLDTYATLAHGLKALTDFHYCRIPSRDLSFVRLYCNTACQGVFEDLQQQQNIMYYFAAQYQGLIVL